MPNCETNLIAWQCLLQHCHRPDMQQLRHAVSKQQPASSITFHAHVHTGGLTPLAVHAKDQALTSHFSCWQVQELLRPFRAVMDSQWHTPKQPDLKATHLLQLKTSDVLARPAFKHVELFHSALRQFGGNSAAALPATPEAVETLAAKADGAAAPAEPLQASAPAGTSPALAPRPFSSRISAEVHSAGVALVDDRYGHHIEVLAVKLQVSWALYMPGGLSLHGAQA